MRFKMTQIMALLLACACGDDEEASLPLETAGTGAPVSGSAAAPAVVGGTGASAAAGSSAPRAGAAALGGSSAVAGSTGAGPGGSAGTGGVPASPGDIGPIAGSSGSPPVAGAAGAPAEPEPPAVACNPADATPEAKAVPLTSITGSSNSAPIVPALGPLMPVIEHDPGLATHTVYRPMTFGDTKYPVVVWANGGCIKNGTMFSRFLLEIASHGFVIVADGVPNGSGMGPLETNGVPQKQALDWIVAENERPCSKFYRKLDTTKIAAMGQSCGGLMTLGVSGDPRLSTVVIWNSGMFEPDEKIYMGLHTPIAYFIGGPDDVAYAQAETDVAAINTVPLFYGNLPVGHSGTYSQDNGGEFARVGIGWLKWQLYGDKTEAGEKMFVGADCALCKGTMWTIEKKMME
jgi:hypothetical protein